MAQGQAQQISVRLDNTAAIRGGRMVLDRFNLAADAGDVIWLQGPNGSGKSTLLRLIAGLLPLAGGTRSVSGSIALVDDHSPLDNHLTLEKALDFWSGMDGAAASERQQAMAAFDLSGISEVPLSYLSSGQRKRANLARMINSDADIWLLDEPYNGLDTFNIGRLDHIIMKHATGGKIAIVAAHKPPSFQVAHNITLGDAAAAIGAAGQTA